MPRFLKVSDASKELGICTQTLRKWVDQNKIPHRTSPGGHRLIDVDAYIAGKSELNPRESETPRSKIFYCRVSSQKQKDDLERQISLAKELYPEHEIVKDIGSGINYKRRGFQSILARLMRGEVEETIVFHRDRICRFGYDLIESIFRFGGAKLKVHGVDEDDYTVRKKCKGDKGFKSDEEELANDLMAIITVFACKQMGKRRYKLGDKTSVEIHKDVPDANPEDDLTAMDG